MSCDNEMTPRALFGAGNVHIMLLRDASGQCVDPPQAIRVPAVQSFTADLGKPDTKTMHGSKQYPLHAANGKMQSELSFECGEMLAGTLTRLYTGGTFKKGGTLGFTDTVGHELPDVATFKSRIQNVITFNLGVQVANTSVTIKQGGTHVAATLVTTTDALTSGQYRFSLNTYEFSAEDVGKEAKITWKCLDKTTQGGSAGTSVVSTLTVPSKRFIKMNAWNFLTSVSGSGLTKVNFATSSTPSNNQYSVQNNGVFIFNSAQASNTLAARTIKHTTDNVVFSSVIATLPAAGYVAIVNPPSTSAYVSDAGVVLASGTISGLSIGDSLTKTATPATGQYDADAGGVYTFAAADANAVVTISFVPDFISVTVSNSQGEIVKDLGVVTQNGENLTRVALTQPLALANNQYATDDNGRYFFDWTNRLDKMYIDYEHESNVAVNTSIDNNDMGTTPLMELHFDNKHEGGGSHVKFFKVIPKSGDFSSKLDDYGTYKFSFMAIADRAAGKVADVTFY